MGEIWEDRMVSERWPRVGKNEKVPVGAKAGGQKKAKAKLLEVERKTSARFQKTKSNTKQKTQRDTPVWGMDRRPAQVLCGLNRTPGLAPH